MRAQTKTCTAYIKGVRQEGWCGEGTEVVFRRGQGSSGGRQAGLMSVSTQTARGKEEAVGGGTSITIQCRQGVSRANTSTKPKWIW